MCLVTSTNCMAKEKDTTEVIPLKEYFDSMFEIVRSEIDFQNKRQDSHGAQMREGFDKVYKKLDDALLLGQKEKKEIEEKLNSIDKRVTAFESHKNSMSQMMTRVLMFFGAASGIKLAATGIETLVKKLSNP